MLTEAKRRKAEKSYIRVRRRYDKLFAEGLCRLCAQPKEEERRNKSYCKKCQKKINEYAIQLRNERRASGRCTSCGGELNDEHITCSECRRLHQVKKGAKKQ